MNQRLHTLLVPVVCLVPLAWGCVPNRVPAECRGSNPDYGRPQAIERSGDEYECPDGERRAAYALAFTAALLILSED